MDLLTAKDKLSIEDFREIQADTYSIPGERLAEHILHLEPEGWLEERTMRQVQGWDFRDEVKSPGAAILQVFYPKLVENAFADELGDGLFADYLRAGEGTFHSMALARILEDPDNHWFDNVNTPQRETRDDMVRESFAEAIDFLGNQFGDEPRGWLWGRLHTAIFDHPLGSVRPLNLIFNRGPVAARGSGSTVNASGFDFGDPFATQVVVSYRQIVDLGDLANSLSMHTTGQSGQPFHQHYADMLKPWQAVDYHPMLFDKESIAANKEGLLVLMPK